LKNKPQLQIQSFDKTPTDMTANIAQDLRGTQLVREGQLPADE